MIRSLIFAGLLSPTLAISQIVKGTVRDSLDGTTLVGANVFAIGTAIGAATDREGEFRITGLPPGQYTIRISYIGYRMKEEPVMIGLDDVELNVHLVPDILETEEVVITAQVRGQMAAINQQITSNTIVSIISEEKIKELPDANAAEAIGRLPGISILRAGGEANKVILRGLEDKFTSFTIDGVKIPPTDAIGRGVDLSMLSQSSLSGVELFKALTPDMDGDALAGSINLVTRKAPETRNIKADLKGDYNRLMNSAGQYIVSLHYGERFLDNLLGVQVTGNFEKRIRSNERINVDYGQQDLPNYFIDNFLLEFTDETRTRDGLSVLLDVNTPDDGTIRISNVFGRTRRDFLTYIRDYPSNNGGNEGGFPSYNYRDRELEIRTLNSSVNGDNTLLGLSVKWSLSFAESQSFYPFDYQMIFVEPSGMNPSPQVQSKPEQLVDYAVNDFEVASLKWQYYRSQDNFDKERTGALSVGKKYFYGELMSGELKFGGKFRVKERSNSRREDFTPYYLGRWQTHEGMPDGSIRPKDFTGTAFEEWLQSGGGFIGLNYFLASEPDKRNIYGSYALNPMLIRDRLRQWWALNKNGLNSNGTQLEVWPNPLIRYDDHFVTERIGAAYVMNTLNVGQTLTVIAGLRLEKEFSDYQSTFMPKPVTGFPVPATSITDTTSSYQQTVVLPNINVSFKPFEFMNLRLAAYKAIGRPDFNMRLNRFIAGRPAESTTQHQVYVGNVNLKTSEAWNLEVNPTFIDETFGLISISAYYKEITNMYHMLNNFNTEGDGILDYFGITWRSQMATTAYNLTLPYNSPKPTKVWGLEFEHQMNFHFLPEPLNNFVLSYNASVVGSETWLYGSQTITYYDSSGPFPVPKAMNILVERKQKLEGMPEFFGNIALGYDLGGFSARVSVFHQGKHNLSFSATGLSDRLTNAFTRIDLALKQRFLDHFVLYLNVNNITNIEDGSSIENRVYTRTLFDQSEQYGLTADFGITIEL
jgi:TonB-dependent receptor